MKRHLKINLFLSSAIIFFLSTVLFAQGRYSIKGIVKDTAGIGLPGVNVNLIETNYGAATGLNGNFEINNLRPGRYTLQFSSIGFSSKTISGIILKDKSVELNIVLRQTAIESKQVVVTASKYAQKISELPVSASVLSSNTLAETNINNLQDAMSFVPGVNMVDDQISIRGSSGYSRGAGTRVLLEIDGVPYYTGDTGEIIWEILPVSEIDRVEVIKGAASSLYGSSAIGGVINVITKKIDEKPVNYAKVYAGFYGKPSYSIWDWSGKTRTFNGLTLARSQRTGKFGYSIALTGLADMGFKQSGFF